jgi:hypothetical protein
MANSFKIEFNINIPHNELFERLSKTEMIGKLRQDLCQNDKTRLLFKNPCKWYSKGQNVLIMLSKNEKEGSKVIINSSCVSMYQLIDFGKNHRNCQLVRDYIYNILKEKEL